MRNQWRLLIIEDDVHAQTVASAVLQHHAIAADVAPTAEAGLELLRQQPYSAVLIDLALPGLDGWGLLKVIQNDPALANLPCIAITAYHSASVAHQAIEAGFTAYFRKPIDAATFVDDLKTYL